MRMAYLALIALTATTVCRAADRVGNGGDICEDRIKIIRDDIRSWIQRGGSAGLALPAGLTLDRYNAGILAGVSAATVSCTSRTLRVGGVEKTCTNFVDSRGRPQLVCNVARFQGTPLSGQYVLIHHEYAGLAGFEVNSGPSSRYPLSNQLTEYLEDQVMKKLAVRKVSSQVPELGGNAYETLKRAFDRAGPARIADFPLLTDVLRGDSGFRCVFAARDPVTDAPPHDAQYAFGRLDVTTPSQGPLLPETTESKMAPAMQYPNRIIKYHFDSILDYFSGYNRSLDTEVLKTFVNSSGDLESLYLTQCQNLYTTPVELTSIYRKGPGVLLAHATGEVPELGGCPDEAISWVPPGYGYCYRAPAR